MRAGASVGGVLAGLVLGMNKATLTRAEAYFLLSKM